MARVSFQREGRAFVFSAMYDRLVAYPDLAGYRLGIIQFSNPSGSLRSADFFTHVGDPIFGHDALDAMTRETYDLWREILEEREEDARKRSGGIRGSLL